MAVLRLPQVDADTLRDVMRDLSRDLDMSRLNALRDDLGHIDLHRGDDLRRELAKLDLPSAGDLRRELHRLERDLPDVRGRLARPARAAFALPTITPTVVLGSVALMAGVAMGGVLAWLYQPGVGVQRRKAVRRRLHRLQRRIQHSR